MNIEYFYNSILDELEGAKTYAKNAIEIKAMNSSWSKMFQEMSAMELSHASNLYKMFSEYCETISKAYPNKNEYVTSMKEELTDCYTKKMTEVKWLHDSLNK